MRDVLMSPCLFFGECFFFQTQAGEMSEICLLISFVSSKVKSRISCAFCVVCCCCCC